jgi:hypothetical protein
MPLNYVLINRQTVTTAVTSVTFSNIPQTGYTDLKVIVSGRFSSGAGFNLIDFNGLSTANFSNRVLEGTGSSAVSFVSGNTNFAGSLNGSGDTANTFSNEEIYIPNYAGNTFKSISFDAVMENNGTTAYTDAGALLWSNVAAITSIRLQTHTGAAYAVGSSFSLYGIATVGTTPTFLPKASGGDIVVNDGTYWIHTFLSSGVFTPSQSLTCDYLVVAGGGGGGNGAQAAANGGGGGAGGFRTATAQILPATAYTVTIGAGGAVLVNGGNSSFNSMISNGGGYGGSNFSPGIVAASGGSGGGRTTAASGAGSGNTPSTSPSQGNNGSNAAGIAPALGGGGGGGAGAAATTPNGGAGASNSFSGSAVTYAGGGGAGTDDGTGIGGTGGGGNGARGATPLVAIAGTANTGGGGGGGASQGVSIPGAAGGSGVVIVRYTMA